MNMQITHYKYQRNKNHSDKKRKKSQLNISAIFFYFKFSAKTLSPPVYLSLLTLMLITLSITFSAQYSAAQEIDGDKKISNNGSDKLQSQNFTNPILWQNLAYFDGTLYQQQAMEMLPVGSHTGSLLEFLHNSTVSGNIDTAGLAASEDLVVANHGSSYLWQRFWLEQNDISSALRPGQSSVHIPIHSWSRFTVRSILSSSVQKNGYNYNLPDLGKIPGDVLQKTEDSTKLPKQNENKFFQTHLKYMDTLGGFSLLPEKTLDREPAFDWGAPSEFRHFQPSYEIDAKLNLKLDKDKYLQLFYEGLFHKRNFQNITQDERSSQNSLLMSYRQGDKDPWKANLIYQRREREYQGIERIKLAENTLEGYKQSSLLQLEKSHSISERKKILHSHLIGMEQQDLSSPNNYFQRDYTNEINNGPLEIPNESRSFFIDSYISYSLANHGMDKVTTQDPWNEDAVWDWQLLSRLRWEHIQIRQDENFTHIAYTYLGEASQVELLEQAANLSGDILRWNPALEKNFKTTLGNIQILLGGKLESLHYNQSFAFTTASPQLSLKLKKKLNNKGWIVYTGLQHDSINLSSQELQFIHSSGGSSNRYNWTDTNGNGIYDSGEEENLLYRSGSPYHKLAEDLRTPSMEEFALGTGFPLSKNWRANIQGTFRLYRNLYIVKYADTYQVDYEEVNRYDNYDEQILYNRSSADIGNEIYELKNQSRPAYYADLEFQILAARFLYYFSLNASLSMHYAEGFTVSGNGFEYNDIGVYSETSADKNSELATRARTAYDRGYVVNIVWTFQPVKSFLISNVMRYRDGEALGRMIIADGLSQGTTIVRTLEPGGPPIGRPRYTYALTWDIRLQYKPELSSTHDLSISFDIFNLLNSQTEIWENTLYDNSYRDPLEAYPERSYRISLMYGF